MKCTGILLTAAIALALASTGCKHEEATKPAETTPPPAATTPMPHPVVNPTPAPTAVPATQNPGTHPATAQPSATDATKPNATPAIKMTPTVAVKPPSIPGLIIKDIKVGSGAEAVDGKSVTVNYTGCLTNGKKFDSSLNPGRTPFEFTLGAGQVIPGWDKGVAGMKVGGKRKLTISPELGYGNSPAGGGVIPANSTLVFDVELLGVK